jgi:CRISPR-associated protein Cas5t
MNAYRVEITAWTASFRYPNFLTAVQPTLEVPPLSTVLGLLNAATGYYIRHENLQIGYYFEFDAKAVDLETIYELEAKKTNLRPTNIISKSNVIQRHFLFDVRLWIYLTDEKLVDALYTPKFPLLLGRSGDLATVKIEEKKVRRLEEQTNANKIKGQIIPFSAFNGKYLPGLIQALPRYFSDSYPRQPLGTEPFSIIRFDSNDNNTNLKAFRDTEKNVDIFFHNIQMSNYE